ncbi:MAG: site-specific integrase [Bacilli bacterium]|nr:site-specific integrase [Bacilli bacterium]
MEFELKQKKYIDFKVYSVTTIKKKYGFRIVLIYEDMEDLTIQRSGFSTKKEANAARDIVITELHNGTFIVQDKVKVKDFFIYWLEKVKRIELTDASYGAYKNIVYNYIIPKLGKQNMITLNKGHIQKLYNEVASCSHDVARLCKTVINVSLKFALDNNVISSNPSKNVNLPKEVKKKKYRTREIDSKKTLNEEQVKLLLEKAKETPIYMQILFAVLMGLRRGEINGLKYSDIDYVHRVLKIQRQLGKKANTDNKDLNVGEYTKQEIKVKTFSSNRELVIPDLVFEAILEERKKYEKNKSRRINDIHNPFKDYDFICCSTYGNPRSKSFHFKYWKKLLKDCELPDIRFHDLRATYCTLLLKNNINEKAVSKQMGHATEIITVDVYGDNEEIIADCLTELEPFIKSVEPKIEMLKNNDFSEDTEVIEKEEKWINKLLSFA